MKRPSTQTLLERVLSQPSAPFREGWARQEIENILKEEGIPFCRDACGNLFAGIKNFRELNSGFRIALLAHMDHPGFHLGERVREGVFRCYWYGGAPFEGMKGAKVRIYDPTDKTKTARGTVLKMEEINPSEERLPFLVQFPEKVASFSKGSFGGFDFPGIQLRGDTVTTRGADDLAGCVIAIGALIDQKRQGGKGPLVAIFTRAEEVGFVGCLDLLKQGVLPKKVWCVSLEASRQLPEAIKGKGPVLRIGDKTCLFDSEFSAVMWRVAQELSKESTFVYQRRLMSGGTCEATPLTLFGHKVTAVAVPLLNYHNFGHNGKPAPEQISLSDVDQARKLCFELGRRLTKPSSWKKNMTEMIVRDFKRLRPLLKGDHFQLEAKR